MNHVPLGTPRPPRRWPKPPARTAAAATLLFLFFQPVKDILLLAKTEMHRISMHPLLLRYILLVVSLSGAVLGHRGLPFPSNLPHASYN